MTAMFPAQRVALFMHLTFPHYVLTPEHPPPAVPCIAALGCLLYQLGPCDDFAEGLFFQVLFFPPCFHLFCQGFRVPHWYGTFKRRPGNTILFLSYHGILPLGFFLLRAVLKT